MEMTKRRGEASAQTRGVQGRKDTRQTVDRVLDDEVISIRVRSDGTIEGLEEAATALSQSERAMRLWWPLYKPDDMPMMLNVDLKFNENGTTTNT